MHYCSSGNKFIWIDPYGYIRRCYSSNEVIGHISSFNKSDLYSRPCEITTCINCDKWRSSIDKDRNIVDNNSLNKRFNIQILITKVCNHWCPYCNHSDLGEKEGYKIYEGLPLSEFVYFLNKMPDETFIEIIGGEPTLREDVHELFKMKFRDITMYSSCLYPSRIEDIIKNSQKYNKNIGFFASCHLYAKGFKMESFWDNVRKLKEGVNTYIHFVSVVNYHLHDKIEILIENAKKIGVPLMIFKLDEKIISPRFDDSFKPYMNNSDFWAYYPDGYNTNLKFES